MPPSTDTSRNEHLAWCKQRALEYVGAGDLEGAFASMVSDMGKNPVTADLDVHVLGMGLLMGGHLSTPDDMRRWIEGFN